MQKMRIVTMQLGMLATNCYLVINEETGELVIIDPAGEADRILARVRQMKARPVAVLLTHGHFDHIGAVVSLQKTYSIPVCAMAEEQELFAGCTEESVRTVRKAGHGTGGSFLPG